VGEGGGQLAGRVGAVGGAARGAWTKAAVWDGSEAAAARAEVTSWPGPLGASRQREPRASVGEAADRLVDVSMYAVHGPPVRCTAHIYISVRCIQTLW
jgi:hypothetical protein